MKVATAKGTDRTAEAALLPNELTRALGANLKRFRQEKQKTQVDLAYDAEVERSRISKLEGGHINPSLLTLATICHCLDITLPQLFEGIAVTIAPVSQGGPARRANQAVLDKPTKSAGKRFNR